MFCGEFCLRGCLRRILSTRVFAENFVYEGVCGEFFLLRRVFAENFFYYVGCLRRILSTRVFAEKLVGMGFLRSVSCLKSIRTHEI